MKKKPKDCPLITFAELMNREDQQLERARGSQPKLFERNIASGGPADEPWVAFTNRDRFGLALSGGGIRSATFNLGLLQALRQKQILEHVDLLSTVSGGGYIGGFWSAWRLRSQEIDPETKSTLIFPKQTVESGGVPGMKDIRERKEIRHLREFSRFLMPRLSLGSIDFWNGAIAILGGMIPSLFLATTILVGAWSLFLFFAITLAGNLNLLFNSFPSQWTAPLAALSFFLLSSGVHCVSEWWWRKERASEEQELKDSTAYTLGVCLSLTSAVFLFLLLLERDGMEGPATPLNFTLCWLAPAAALAISGIISLFVRIIPARYFHGSTGLYLARAFDRGIARCLAPAVLWFIIIALWWIATDGLDQLGGGTTKPTAGLFAVGGSAAALFALLRQWLGSVAKEAMSGHFLARFKPVLPKLAANVAVVVFVMLTARLIPHLMAENHYGAGIQLLGVSVLGLLITALAAFLLNPARIGLHEFYRSRISRCFLGAANYDALAAGNSRKGQEADGFNRQTHERALDDFSLGELAGNLAWIDRNPLADKTRMRPIHLVCCAANNLAGDQLGTLYRGARSAVISAQGVSLGGDTRFVPDLSFSAALTASAAAFNSNMGFISMDFGPAVAFLTTALNLRLGLWVPHPRVDKPLLRFMPGILFLAEMFGRTLADNSATVKGHTRSRTYGYAGWLHLSDGNHFENFGLYELIRRHTRYIILSDCGADPANSFDDFARTARRVREDFGVEFELDLTPLKPNDQGFSPQHVAVGTIHYDGVTGADKGTLVYFKPVLSGDEPADVLQYKEANRDFPQQTTVDQFYDEPQWESYRRLGEHAGQSAFRFLELRPRGSHNFSVDSIFHKVVEQWQRSGETNAEFASLFERVATMESEFRQTAPKWMCAQFFPETGDNGDDSKATPREQTDAIFHLLSVVQLMEEIWRLADLETMWSHPGNQGWMAYFHRWAETPAFRRWWPIVKSTCDYAFGKFVQIRLGLTYNSVDDSPANPQPATPNSAGLKIRPFIPGDKDSLVVRRWEQQFGMKLDRADRVAFIYELLPCAPIGQPVATSITVGLALVSVTNAPGKTLVTWSNTPDLFVPPALEGSGFIGRLLDALIKTLKSPSQGLHLTVSLAEPVGRHQTQGLSDQGSRARRVRIIDFYKSRGFVLKNSATTNTPELLSLDLAP